MDKEKKKERLGYGFKRTERAFASMKCDRLFLDFKGTDRAARFDMLYHVGLRPGDVVCVIRESDLGFGVDLKQVREMIQSAGATIEIAPPSKNNPQKAVRRGMPDEAKAFARRYWLPGVSPEYINSMLAAEGKKRGDDPKDWGPFTRSQFKTAFGPKTPPADAPVEVEK